MRKLKKATATLGGIAVASTMAFGVSVAFAPSAQADCTWGEGLTFTCTQVEAGTPHKNWTTENTLTWNPFNISLHPFKLGITKDTAVKNPAGKEPPGQQ
jgi:hypothetical protein